jgi:hypothetical protein
MSEMPQFQYTTANGESKSFIDPCVYTSNRQFRLLLCNKLSHRSRTALRISSPPTIALFTRSCITHIEDIAGWIPPEAIPRMTTRKSSTKNQRTVRRELTGGTALEAPTPLRDFLRQLLHKQGQPSGALTLVNQTKSELKFRWQVSPGLLRPCMTAQIWRPSQPGHTSNGSWVTVDSSGGVYLTCLHPQCLQRGYSNKRLLGYVPLSLLSLCSSGDSGVAEVMAERDGDGCDLDTDVGVGGNDCDGGDQTDN